MWFICILLVKYIFFLYFKNCKFTFNKSVLYLINILLLLREYIILKFIQFYEIYLKLKYFILVKFQDILLLWIKIYKIKVLNNFTIIQCQDQQKDPLTIVVYDLYQKIQKDHKNLHFFMFLFPCQIYFKPWCLTAWINLVHHSDLNYIFYLHCMNRMDFSKLEDFCFGKDRKNHFTMFFEL